MRRLLSPRRRSPRRLRSKRAVHSFSIFFSFLSILALVFYYYYYTLKTYFVIRVCGRPSDDEEWIQECF